MRFSLLLLVVVGFTACADAQDKKPTENPDVRLAEKLLPLVKAHKGDVAVCIRQLSGPNSKTTFANAFEFNQSKVMPTASLIKLAVMVTAHRMIDTGKLKLDQEITLTADDKVPGSGILTSHFSPGTKLTLRDAIRLMIVYSDNTATNLVLDATGLKSTRETMQALGFPETRINSKVYKGSKTTIDPERSSKYGLGSTTAAETIELLQRLHSKNIASQSACDMMLSDLKACEGNDKIAAGLPPGVKFAHKTGSISHARCDAGIAYGKTATFAICVLTANNEDRSWNETNAAQILCKKIGRVTHDHFNPPWKSGTHSQDETLSVGAFGPLVEMLQRTLNERSNPSPELSVDGDFGPATKSAVIKFQAANQLPSNGIVAASTWKALGTLVAEKESRTPAEVNSEQLKRDPVDAMKGDPFVTCKSYMVLGEDGVLWSSKNMNESRPMASTTKIMTAAIVLKLAESNPNILNEQITFSERADQTRGSTAGVRAGESLSVHDCLYGLLLPSGNDAAIALAEHFGHRFGSADPKVDPLKLFVEEMNTEAVRQSMQSSIFKNPHGLDEEGHIMSAGNLIALASHTWKNELFREIVGTRQYGTTVTGKGGYERNVVWKNTNRLLEIEGYDGIKTGTTSRAGACLVSTSERYGYRVFIAVLGSSSSEARYADIRNLYRETWRKAVSRPRRPGL